MLDGLPFLIEAGLFGGMYKYVGAEDAFGCVCCDAFCCLRGGVMSIGGYSIWRRPSGISTVLGRDRGSTTVGGNIVGGNASGSKSFGFCATLVFVLRFVLRTVSLGPGGEKGEGISGCGVVGRRSGCFSAVVGCFVSGWAAATRC